MANQTATKPKVNRQADPDVARIRTVKEAARKLVAATRAAEKAVDRKNEAFRALNDLLGAAPEDQRDYLRSVAGLPWTDRSVAGLPAGEPDTGQDGPSYPTTGYTSP